MSDLISRADAIEAVRLETGKLGRGLLGRGDILDIISALPSAEAKGANLINRHDATTVIREECWKCNRLINADLLGRILALPTSRQTDCTEFIEWLIEIILDDEDWELNAVGYGEIIARKLKKLGLLEVKDGYYIRPSAEAVTHGRLIDADALSEKLCETTIFIKDGEVFQRMINDAPTVSAEVVPQSEQYKRGFEDAKRAFLLEYARESENMRKRNAQLEVMINAHKAISAEAAQGCDGCRYNTRITEELFPRKKKRGTNRRKRRGL